MEVKTVEVNPNGAGKGFGLVFGFHVSHKDLQKQISLTPGEQVVMVDLTEYQAMKEAFDNTPKSTSNKTEDEKPTKAQASAWFKKHGGNMDLITPQ